MPEKDVNKTNLDYPLFNTKFVLHEKCDNNLR
jgi:hypothetical protein